MFNCRICRNLIFNGDNLINHEISKHNFQNNKTNSNGSNLQKCTSYFLKNPEEWMNTGEVNGKIYCYKCNTKLGSYNWSGCQCSCGTWVVPSIQINKSKVDEKNIISGGIVFTEGIVKPTFDQ